MTVLTDEVASFRFLLRNDTAANWANQNPILAAGEPGVETDTHYMKLGDGLTAWNDLTYTGDVGPAGPEGPEGPQGEVGPQGYSTLLIWDGAAYPARPPTGSVVYSGPVDPGPDGLDIMLVGDGWWNTDED